jgi:hypothetical protein
MEVRSKHYIDTARWVCKVIQSCETPIQATRCRHLIYNWEAMWGNKPAAVEIYRELRRELDFKLQDIFDNLKKLRPNESTVS